MGLLASIAPRWALKRAIARAQIERLYDAAKTHHQHPLPSNGRRAADSVMEHARDKITVWARHLDENHDLVTGLLDQMAISASRVVVEPMVKRAGGQLAERVNDQLADLWRRWSDTADLNGSLSWCDLAALAARSWLRDGEIFVNHVQGVDGAVLPYALEVLEADFVPFDYTRSNPTVVHGIEKDSDGRPVAYHFYREHPGNADTIVGPFISNRDLFRVPAELVSHVKHAKRLHQTRGVSVLHSVVHRLDDLHEYEESERIKARIQASVSLFIQTSPQWGQTIGVDSITGEEPFEMDAGQVHRLAPGESITAPAATSPNPELADFRRAMLRAVAAGVGVRYSTLARDYTDGSYSSQRQELVESRAFEDARRSSWVAQFMRPVWRRFVQSAILTGQVASSAASVESLYDAEFSGVSVPWIDLQKEVAADQAAVAAGFKSRKQVIRERGGTVREVDQEREEDVDAPQMEVVTDEQQTRADRETGTV